MNCWALRFTKVPGVRLPAFAGAAVQPVFNHRAIDGSRLCACSRGAAPGCETCGAILYWNDAFLQASLVGGGFLVPGCVGICLEDML